MLSCESCGNLLSIKELNSIKYFICNTCNNKYPIENETVIYTKDNEQIAHISHYEHMNKYDNTLPRTRNFVCPNDKCDSHGGESEAVIIRQLSGVIKYLCCKCDMSFEIS